MIDNIFELSSILNSTAFGFIMNGTDYARNIGCSVSSAGDY
ncbi:MAG: hypothetical protein AB8V23_01360 [Candidatus Midichloria sp.]|uniref:FG-GAP repeat-containing protein n=1 Tax=Hyalomma marginatum TaxID=34627 RepID=A0A8S4C3T5_9ACAR|nr:FG-GAP repeat-containing protein [Hyalomma marginatum]CAG7598705.1 FG-GAP repeat-containing protein [Hyalomma marginatum]